MPRQIVQVPTISRSDPAQQATLASLESALAALGGLSRSPSISTANAFDVKVRAA